MAYIPKYLKLLRESTYIKSCVAGSFYVDIVDESMNPDQGYIDAETAGYLEPRLRLPGGYIVTGDVGMLLDPHTVCPVLDAFTGKIDASAVYSEVAGSKIYSYVFKPTLKPKTLRATLSPNVEETFGGGTYKAREMRGFAIKSIEISARAREACVMTLTCQAVKDKLVNRDAAVSFPTVRPFTFSDGTLSTVGGDSVDIEEVTFRAERVIADDNYAIGSRFLPFLHAAGVSLSGTLTFGFKDWSMYKKFWGSATATEPQLSPESYALELKFESDPIYSAGTKKFMLHIEAPKIYLDTSAAPITRRERIIQTCDFTGIYDTAAGYAVKFTVRNKKSNIWTAG